MTHSRSGAQVFSFTVKEVALWRALRSERSAAGVDADLLAGSCDGRDVTSRPEAAIRVDVPPVQRGLVWDVAQIEIFWDSLMRGFPFGALVLVPDKRANQPEHYLLFDGQQRCDAIYWGLQPDFGIQGAAEQILWLDLLPGDRLEKTNRHFLLRLTTRAHPWGFWRDDSASALSLSNRREFFEQFEALKLQSDEEACKAQNSDGEQPTSNSAGWRPAPSQCVPFDAGLPVPLPVIFQNFKNGQIDWGRVAEDKLVQLAQRWKGKTIAEDFLGTQSCERIEEALRKACSTQVVAIAPPADIGDTEELFTRLNRNGSPLSEEELAYSLIKVGWPDIKSTMDAVSAAGKRHAGEARLIRMGMRVARSAGLEPGSSTQKLEPPLTTAQIRQTFFTPSPTAEVSAGRSCEDDIKQQVQARARDRQLLVSYFLASDGGVDGDSKFLRGLRWVDEQLGFRDGRDFGIPNYMRSAIAWSASEVFSWLLLQAEVHNYRPLDDGQAKRLLAWATSLWWFANDRENAVNRLTQLSAERHGLENVRLDAIKDPQGQKILVFPVLRPEQLSEAIQLTADLDEGLLRAWNQSIWEGVVNSRSGGRSGDLAGRLGQSWADVGYSVERIRRNFDLLVYAQRGYISRVFAKFDPSDQRLWKGHNRPWDYDHILARALLDARGSKKAGAYHKACKVWQESIGNFVAIDLVDNRSMRDAAPVEEKAAVYVKLANERGWNPLLHLLNDGGNEDWPALADFALELHETNSAERAWRFIHACQRRMVALYREWFDALDVKQLLMGGDGQSGAE